MGTRADGSIVSLILEIDFRSKIQCLESLKVLVSLASPLRFVYARIDRPAGTIKFGPLAEPWRLEAAVPGGSNIVLPNTREHPKTQGFAPTR